MDLIFNWAGNIKMTSHKRAFNQTLKRANKFIFHANAKEEKYHLYSNHPEMITKQFVTNLNKHKYTIKEWASCLLIQDTARVSLSY